MPDSDAVLGVVGVTVVVMMMVLYGSEGRAGKQHQQEGGGKNLLHGKNLARGPRRC
jgi:hypothetical protein